MSRVVIISTDRSLYIIGACPTTITIRPTHTPTRDATREPTNEPTFSAIQIGFSGDGLGPSNIDPNIDIRSVPPCSGHGRCKTMREAGENFDGRYTHLFNCVACRIFSYRIIRCFNVIEI